MNPEAGEHAVSVGPGEQVVAVQATIGHVRAALTAPTDSASVR